MHTLARFLVAAAILGLAGIASGADAKPAALYTGKVSALRLAASELGDDWTGPTGVVIDDFSDLSRLNETEKTVAQVLKKSAPAGAVGCADFTYRRKSNPLQQTTLRVFVFDSEDSCRQWWLKKYRHDGWEKYYKVVDGVAYDAVDSTEVTKRAVAFGNVWMTCGTLGKPTDHLHVLDLYIKKVKSLAQSDKP